MREHKASRRGVPRCRRVRVAAHSLEARTVLTSAGEGDSLPPICACENNIRGEVFFSASKPYSLSMPCTRRCTLVRPPRRDATRLATTRIVPSPVPGSVSGHALLARAWPTLHYQRRA